MSKGGASTKFDTSKIAELRQQGLTHQKIADEIGCTQGYVSRLLSQQGLGVGKGGGANAAARDNAKAVIESIKQNGGSIRQAIEKLELDVATCTVRTVAKELGIDLMLYRHIGMTKGHWVVALPYPGHSTSGVMSKVPVTCKECGHETEISWYQLGGRRPPVCTSCGAHSG